MRRFLAVRTCLALLAVALTAGPVLQTWAAERMEAMSSSAMGGSGNCKDCAGNNAAALPGVCMASCIIQPGVVAELPFGTPLVLAEFPRPMDDRVIGVSLLPDPHPPKPSLRT